MVSKETEKEFKEIEHKLIKLLKSASLNICDGDDSEKTKALIRSHIEKVNEAKGLFERYEILAKKLQNFDDDNETQSLEKSEEMLEVKNIAKSKNEKPAKFDRKIDHAKRRIMIKAEKEKIF